MGNHVTFSNDWQFRQTFGRKYVREGVLVKLLKELCTMLTNPIGSGKDSGSPTRILVLSRVAIDFSQQLAPSLVNAYFSATFKFCNKRRNHCRYSV